MKILMKVQFNIIDSLLIFGRSVIVSLFPVGSKFRKNRFIRTLYFSLLWRQRQKIVVKRGPLSGFLLRKDEYIRGGQILNGEYEPTVQAYFKEYIKEGDVAMDIGANMGAHTLYLSKLVGNPGFVYSFEPFEKPRTYLEEIIKLNQCRNVIVSPLAIWDSASQIYLHKQINGILSWVSDSPKLGDCTFRVNVSRINTVTLDEFVYNEAIPRVDFIKMDIDGAEKKAIFGMKVILEKYRPVIIIECHDFDGFNFCSQYISDFRYEIKEFFDPPKDEKHPFLLAVPNEKTGINKIKL